MQLKIGSDVDRVLQFSKQKGRTFVSSINGGINIPSFRTVSVPFSQISRRSATVNTRTSQDRLEVGEEKYQFLFYALDPSDMRVMITAWQEPVQKSSDTETLWVW